MKTKSRILTSIHEEIKIQAGYLDNESISSIYFGGGTPSILESKEIEKIIATLTNHHNIKSDVEITLECNPDDLNQKKLEALYDIGINRLSIGIQSFRDKDLTLMNRAHHAQEAKTSVHLTKKTGFKNLTIDLIYGVPEMSLADWKANLQEAIQLDVPHISSYCLTIEKGTAFNHFVEQKRITPVTDDLASEQYQTMVELLNQAGYEHYEVSNFAKPGFISRHNSSYWQNKKYLGIGPSAHSYNGISRQWNVASNTKYYKTIEAGKPFFEKETLSLHTRYNEYLLTGLRTKWGIDLDYINNNFSINFLTANSKLIAQLLENKDVTIEDHIFRLTEKGLLRADGISSDFFVVE